MPALTAAAATQPQLFLFLGDNVYADTDDAAQLQRCYDTLGARTEFRQLRATTPIEAVWDDHDFGRNDVGKEYPIATASQRIFLDFFEVASDDPRRSRPGTYATRMLDDQTQLVLLDTRQFRDPLTLKTGPIEPAALGRRGPYTGGPGTVLGDAQWAWLEETLKQPAKRRLVASSIQVIANEHGFEKWGLFPAERERLLDLLFGCGSDVLVLSGDRHHGEINRLDRDGRSLWELTASSLNKPGTWKNERNPHRIGSRYLGANFGHVAIDPGSGGMTLRILNDRGTAMLQAEAFGE